MAIKSIVKKVLNKQPELEIKQHKFDGVYTQYVSYETPALGIPDMDLLDWEDSNYQNKKTIGLSTLYYTPSDLPLNYYDNTIDMYEKIYTSTKPYDHEVLYLESDGHQYIDIGKTPSEIGGIDCEFMILNLPASDWHAIWGTEKNISGWKNFWLRYERTTPYLKLDCGYGEGSRVSIPNVSINDRVSMRIRYTDSRHYAEINGQFIELSYKDVSMLTSSIYLFAQNGGSSNPQKQGSCRIYGFTVYNKNMEKMIDLHPVVKDGIGCMYDRMTRNIYQNLGSSNFSVGENTSNPISIFPICQTPVKINFDTGSSAYLPEGWTQPNYYIGSKYNNLPVPVLEDDDYKFNRWVDASGNTITAQSYIKPNDSLSAVYLPLSDFVKFEVEATDSSKIAGFYTFTRKDTSKPVVVNWGDGSTENLYSASDKTHTYASNGTYIVTIENIKNMAFSRNASLTYRSALTRVLKTDTELGSNTRSFSSCVHLKTCNLKNPGSIGSYAFAGCGKLESITIPSTVKSIGSNAFASCTSLASVDIPNSVTSIAEYAFWGCTSLTSIYIPDSVTSLSSWMFYQCTNLTSVRLPNNITTIWGGFFNACSNLTNLTIPESVASFGAQVFNGCNSLTSVLFLGKTTEQVKSMSGYPWGIPNSDAMHGELS